MSIYLLVGCWEPVSLDVFVVGGAQLETGWDVMESLWDGKLTALAACCCGARLALGQKGELELFPWSNSQWISRLLINPSLRCPH